MDGPWQLEWAEEVQSLLERDAGWGWKGFWETVSRNVKVSSICLGAQVVSEVLMDRVRPLLIISHQHLTNATDSFAS